MTVPRSPSAGSASGVRFTGVQGNFLAADEKGSAHAPTVLLLHGGGQTRHAWHRAQEDLAGRGYRAISVDARGHGDSDWVPDGNYSLEAFADDLAAVITQISRPVSLVGASLGGLTALVALARDAHLNCENIVLVDVVPRPNPGGVAQIIAFMESHPDGFANLDEAADAISLYLPGRVRPKSSQGLAKNLRVGNDGRYRWHWDPKILDYRDDEGRLLGAMEKVIHEFRRPMLLIRGQSSEVVTDNEINEFRRSAPHVSIVDIRGAGHMVSGDVNDVFANAVAAFLDESSSFKGNDDRSRDIHQRSGPPAS